MNLSTKMILVLTAITTISGAILSIWDGYTKPEIEKYRQKELVKAIADVLPPYEYFEKISGKDLILYVGKNKGADQPVGIAFRAIGSGFQGKISVMVGVKPDFTALTGIKVLEQIETPGLGTKIVVDPSNKADPYWFPKQFKGVDVQHEIVVVKNVKPSKNNEIQAISGATITSVAVARIIDQQIQLAKTIFKHSQSNSSK